MSYSYRSSNRSTTGFSFPGSGLGGRLLPESTFRNGFERLGTDRLSTSYSHKVEPENKTGSIRVEKTARNTAGQFSPINVVDGDKEKSFSGLVSYGQTVTKENNEHTYADKSNTEQHNEYDSQTNAINYGVNHNGNVNNLMENIGSERSNKNDDNITSNETNTKTVKSTNTGTTVIEKKTKEKVVENRDPILGYLYGAKKPTSKVKEYEVTLRRKYRSNCPDEVTVKTSSTNEEHKVIHDRFNKQEEPTMNKNNANTESREKKDGDDNQESTFYEEYTVEHKVPFYHEVTEVVYEPQETVTEEWTETTTTKGNKSINVEEVSQEKKATLNSQRNDNVSTNISTNYNPTTQYVSRKEDKDITGREMNDSRSKSRNYEVTIRRKYDKDGKLNSVIERKDNKEVYEKKTPEKNVNDNSNEQTFFEEYTVERKVKPEEVTQWASNLKSQNKSDIIGGSQLTVQSNLEERLNASKEMLEKLQQKENELKKKLNTLDDNKSKNESTSISEMDSKFKNAQIGGTCNESSFTTTTSTFQEILQPSCLREGRQGEEIKSKNVITSEFDNGLHGKDQPVETDQEEVKPFAERQDTRFGEPSTNSTYSRSIEISNVPGLPDQLNTSPYISKSRARRHEFRTSRKSSRDDLNESFPNGITSPTSSYSGYATFNAGLPSRTSTEFTTIQNNHIFRM